MPYVNTYEAIGEQNTLDRLVANTLTSFTDDRIRVVGRGAFYRTNLEELRLPNCMYINSDTLYHASSLKRLILDINDGALCYMNNQFSNVDAAHLIVYVPDELVDTYKSENQQLFHTNTSSMNVTTSNVWALNGYAPRIYGISQIGGTHEWLEQEITDSWETIGAHISAGDAAETYHLGMYKPVDLGSGGIINFQIIGHNQDTISGTNSTAQLTWCAMETLRTSMPANPQIDGDTMGTGVNGGWPYSSIRTYLSDTILPLFPSSVSTLIKSVDKVSKVYDPTNENNHYPDVSSVDKLFLLSKREVCDSGSKEGSGPEYIMLSTNSARIRKYSQGDVNMDWWLRSVVYGSAQFNFVNSGGNIGGMHYQSNSYIIPGFCT